MSNTLKNGVMMICLALMLLFVGNVKLSAYICANGAGLGYCDINPKPGCPSGRMASGGQGIESLVEESAVHFSTSFSEFLKITAKLEASGLDKLDYKGLAAISRNSLGEIEFCRDLYKELVNRAEQTPYNSVFIEKLKRFDYAAFTRGRGLNTPLYNKVRGFLVRGDLNGLLKLFSNKTETLTGLVAQVDHEISRTGCVTLESIWSVNDAFAELMLLEQYAARIFKSAN